MTGAFWLIHKQIIQAQQDRDARVQRLWETIVDTLDFMKDAEPLEAIRGLEKTVQAMMKQIYVCALFLRCYEERGFTGEDVLN